MWLTGDGVREDLRKPEFCRVTDCYRHACRYVVDGRSVSVDKGNTALLLENLYPGEVVKGVEGARRAEVGVTVIAPKAGEYRIYRVNDYFGRLFVNGEYCGECDGPYEGYSALEVRLKEGVNRLSLRTRAGVSGSWRVGLALDGDSPLRFER